MKRRYRVVDVFTDRAFGGNPLAVVLDAEGLGPETMQSIAAEFGFSETTFVLPPPAPDIDALVRIFTPACELPFAGHPNIGTGFVLATLRGGNQARLTFREGAGDVVVSPLYRNGVPTGAELRAPQPFTRGAAVPVADAAACLSLPATALRTDRHPPVVASVGLPFLFVELPDLSRLTAAAPAPDAHRATLPQAGTDGVMAYVADGTTLRARMFAPLGGVREDPATGSAAAALAALLADCAGVPGLAVTILQGIEMGRPSLLEARSQQEAAGRIAHVSGQCVNIMDGVLTIGDQA